MNSDSSHHEVDRHIAAVKLLPEFSQTRWICSQIGAREHYSVPATLQQAGLLRQLYTDLWVGRWRSLIDRGPASVRSLAGRMHAAIPTSKVVAFTPLVLWNEVQRRGRSLCGANDSADEHYVRIGQSFAEAVVGKLKQCELDPARDRFFGYNTGSLETMSYLNEQRVPTVLGQIDPGRVAWDLLQAEREKWPGWEPESTGQADTYFARIANEWRLATRVLVNSQWSRDALIRQGVPAHKIVLVPLAYEPPPNLLRTRENTHEPLTVLWVGNVVLQKGIQYLIEAARRLPAECFRFIVAGPIGISDVGLRRAPQNMQFLGPVRRQDIPSLYLNADLYVLPTISDGFALTQLEALSYGLPVIITPHCARLVTNEVEGYVIEPGEVEPLVVALQRCEADRVRLRAMSQAAIEKSRQFSPAQLLRDLQTHLTELGPRVPAS